MNAATYNERYIKALEKKNKDLAAYIQELERERDTPAESAHVKQSKGHKEPARDCQTAPAVTVQITYGREGLWYSRREGERFQVRNDGRSTFTVVKTGRLINKDDCIVVAIDYGNEETAGNGRPAGVNLMELE